MTASHDITFCTSKLCVNKLCPRHKANIDWSRVTIGVSMADFKDCPWFKRGGGMKVADRT